MIKQARHFAGVAIRRWPGPKSGGDNNLLTNFVLLLSVKVSVYPHEKRGWHTAISCSCLHCLQSRSLVFTQLLHGYVLSMSTDALHRCLRLWSSELKSDGTGQCLYFSSVLLTDHTEMCWLHVASLGWSQMLAKANEEDV